MKLLSQGHVIATHLVAVTATKISQLAKSTLLLLALLAPAGHTLADTQSTDATSPALHAHKQRVYLRDSVTGVAVNQSELTRQANQFVDVYFVEGWGQQRQIALTFDDGPSQYTRAILDILDRHQAKASFFWMGNKIAANQAIVTRALQAGHTVANHSWSHPHGATLSAKQLWQQQIAPTNQALAKVTGEQPAFYRPPFGEISDEQVLMLAQKGMRTVLWSVDTRDWDEQAITAKHISQTVISQAHPEMIALMHDDGGNRSATVQALPVIIEHYQALGYQLVSLDTLLKAPQPTGSAVASD
ncbi:polysaccharide deacetylase family protein [Shewanella sp. Scap07]|uniref:polysaccharide deacetylase family protein n=1 Tax=Shewanella sp. Scap07 TaxID=2589987 RepID=UPI0015BEC1A1|nr:polysaccharide deacetylase family protein [Shewanella sp. Scap07]QLE87017.1 polysaccharide deacetylase family protein [Shewanella sp. Scap07]